MARLDREREETLRRLAELETALLTDTALCDYRIDRPVGTPASDFRFSVFCHSTGTAYYMKFFSRGLLPWLGSHSWSANLYAWFRCNGQNNDCRCYDGRSLDRGNQAHWGGQSDLLGRRASFRLARIVTDSRSRTLWSDVKPPTHVWPLVNWSPFHDPDHPFTVRV